MREKLKLYQEKAEAYADQLHQIQQVPLVHEVHPGERRGVLPGALGSEISPARWNCERIG